MNDSHIWRNTTQDLLPVIHTPTASGQYDLYPGYDIGGGKIFCGHAALAAKIIQEMAHHSQVIIDGYGGVFWDMLRDVLDEHLHDQGIRANWVDVSSAMRPEASIDTMIEPFLGGDDPIFGRRFSGELVDFFNETFLALLKPDPAATLNIIYGSGAALASWDGLLIYVDLPKNEIQFRARAGSIDNLGASRAAAPKPMYKRFYFVDWIALNKHKAALLPDIDIVVDEQRPEDLSWMTGDDLRAALDEMAANYFRVRPWFEPGVWGGQWIKEKIPQLPQDAVNYAWSFELIVPENGLLLESDGALLEVSFDMLLFHDHGAVLGDCASFFQYEFPIRFDFLDTFDGGNLSVQCHPRPEFIRRHFGETYTQDETYYILDSEPGAQIYLGFVEEIDPAEFRTELEHSFAEASPVEIERFVNTEPANKHDLFLIPNGTIHCSGVNTMVLEISATPYIFTFKMYDWMRLDLDGKPRPLNIKRAFQNLRFERKGQRATDELVSKPVTINSGPDWQLIHLPTHPAHFYDVHRYEFSTTVEGETNGSCHVMSLVEGESVMLETANGARQQFSYTETFVVPAGAGSYRLINQGEGMAKVIKAFVKPVLPDTI